MAAPLPETHARLLAALDAAGVDPDQLGTALGALESDALARAALDALFVAWLVTVGETRRPHALGPVTGARLAQIDPAAPAQLPRLAALACVAADPAPAASPPEERAWRLTPLGKFAAQVFCVPERTVARAHATRERDAEAAAEGPATAGPMAGAGTPTRGRPR